MALQVLVVDDSRVSRMQTEAQLETLKSVFDMKITFAENGEEAVKSVLENNQDVVILDVEMTIMTGLETCSIIRSVSPSTRVALLTSLAGVEDFKIGREAGCKHYLLKPVNASDLRTILRLAELTKNCKVACQDREASHGYRQVVQGEL